MNRFVAVRQPVVVDREDGQLYPARSMKDAQMAARTANRAQAQTRQASNDPIDRIANLMVGI